ncbi:MAG TPA: hypothetical protein VHP11_14495 [Tepidisphaeraceae bacterium]|nr:hypothetical protein [Tepidisphaeraceae bacterium]
MDIVNAYSNWQRSVTTAQVQMAVAKRVLNVQRQEGAAIVQMIQAASQGPAQAGDELVAAATGLGSMIDVRG